MVAQPGGKHSFLVASDIHIGSKHHLADKLEDFVERAYARGVRTGLCPGDLLDGNYRHSVWEQSHRGFDEQCREAARSLPRRPGFQWHFILGNHDMTLEEGSGLDVGRAIVDTFRSEGRTDWTYHGSRGAYLRLGVPGERGIVVEMWHPCKGGGYALSYKMQNHIRDYAVGYKPDALFVGHWHQQCYFVSRGVHALSSGTWQGGRSAYGKSLGGSPSIGGWVIDYNVTKDGTIREFTPTWNAYYENEQARDIVLGEAMSDYTGI
jgi:3',5'-cyclic AMP phosphodiesterase CpdA